MADPLSLLKQLEEQGHYCIVFSVADVDLLKEGLTLDEKIRILRTWQSRHECNWEPLETVVNEHVNQS